jgi:23S rRNA (uracil1939-C5)-methyltransferase
MKKGQIYEGMVENIDFPNKGIVHIENDKVSVKNALPGQKVRFCIQKVRKNRCEGRLLEVVESSELETRSANCRHFGECGGCAYQTLPYQEQLSLKVIQVKKLIDAVCTNYTFEGIKQSPMEWGYRNKMEFSFGDEIKNGSLALGLHKKGSFYDIVTADDCKLVHHDYNLILNCVLDYFKERGTSFYHKLTHTGYLRHLLIRRATKTGEMLINLVTTMQEAVDVSALVKALLMLGLEGRIVGILHIFNDSLADVVQSDRMEILYGQDCFYEEILGIRFKITPFSFFQTNSLGAEVLYDTVRSYAGETKDNLIFDLYCGTGTIAQILAPVAGKVIGVEIVEEAVIAARENAAHNGLTNCEFIAGDVLKVIDSLDQSPDLIILDPPRDGIHPKALEKIAGSIRPPKMVYISCKPTSLARDLVILQEFGYEVEKVCCVDMFPQTVHVETVVLMSRVKD